MSLLKPDYRFDKITDIKAEDLKKAGAKLLLLDADNTLSFHGSQTPFPGVPEWISEIKKSGFELVIISNNSERRIKPFAENLGLPFVYKSAKPLPKGFKKATENFICLTFLIQWRSFYCYSSPNKNKSKVYCNFALTNQYVLFGSTTCNLSHQTYLLISISTIRHCSPNNSQTSSSPFSLNPTAL